MKPIKNNEQNIFGCPNVLGDLKTNLASKKTEKLPRLFKALYYRL